MITRTYIQEMARYNCWQNNQLSKFLQKLSSEDLMRDRGAFFKSIMGTANHLVWGSWIWISRFDKGLTPDSDISKSALLCSDFEDWLTLCTTIDNRIIQWAKTLISQHTSKNKPVKDEIITGLFTWHSAAKNTKVTKPYAQCIVHMFNHQTHHRGQLHQMLTEVGFDAPVSDFVFLPNQN